MVSNRVILQYIGGCEVMVSNRVILEYIGGCEVMVSNRVILEYMGGCEVMVSNRVILEYMQEVDILISLLDSCNSASLSKPHPHRLPLFMTTCIPPRQVVLSCLFNNRARINTHQWNLVFYLDIRHTGFFFWCVCLFTRVR